MELLNTSKVNTDRLTGFSAAKLEADFINNCGVPITVVFRSGNAVKINPSSKPGKDQGTFKVYRKLRAHPDARINPDGLNFKPYIVLAEHTPIDPRAARENGRIHGATFSIEYDELKKHGSIYDYELDIVISVLDKKHIPEHPARTMCFSQLSDTINKGSGSITVNVNDKGNILKNDNCYAVIHGEVVKVKVTRLHHIPDGIYVVKKSKTERSGNVYSLDDEACPIKVYETKAEAITMADEMKDMLVNNDKQVKELKELERIVDKKLADLDDAGERYGTQARQRLDDVKRFNEERYKREESGRKIKEQKLKGASDWIKYLPPVVAVVCTVISLVVGNSKNGDD